jgi:rhodanese-related sulfurtransferase
MKHAILLVLVSIVALSTAIADKPKPDQPGKAFANLPEKKQTALGLYVTAGEAHDRWRAAPIKTVILDVRTPEEYYFIGHAPMAYNVPFAFWKSDVFPKGGKPVMKPNSDFLARVKKIASPGETILVMCRSGGRSAKAVNALAKAGYTKVYNVVDGFEGDMIKDPENAYNGKRMKNGWRNAGRPWTYEVRKPLMYLPEKK